MRLILAGRNAVVVDTIEALVMKCDPKLVPHLTKLEADGLGTTDAAKITVVGKQVSDVAKAFAVNSQTAIRPGKQQPAAAVQIGVGRELRPAAAAADGVQPLAPRPSVLLTPGTFASREVPRGRRIPPDSLCPSWPLRPQQPVGMVARHGHVWLRPTGCPVQDSVRGSGNTPECSRDVRLARKSPQRRGREALRARTGERRGRCIEGGSGPGHVARLLAAAGA
jgi:hypothetical protein